MLNDGQDNDNLLNHLAEFVVKATRFQRLGLFLRLVIPRYDAWPDGRVRVTMGAWRKSGAGLVSEVDVSTAQVLCSYPPEHMTYHAADAVVLDARWKATEESDPSPLGRTDQRDDFLVNQAHYDVAPRFMRDVVCGSGTDFYTHRPLHITNVCTMANMVRNDAKDRMPRGNREYPKQVRWIYQTKLREFAGQTRITLEKNQNLVVGSYVWISYGRSYRSVEQEMLPERRELRGKSARVRSPQVSGAVHVCHCKWCNDALHRTWECPTREKARLTDLGRIRPYVAHHQDEAPRGTGNPSDAHVKPRVLQVVDGLVSFIVEDYKSTARQNQRAHGQNVCLLLGSLSTIARDSTVPARAGDMLTHLRQIKNPLSSQFITEYVLTCVWLGDKAQELENACRNGARSEIEYKDFLPDEALDSCAYQGLTNELVQHYLCSLRDALCPGYARNESAYPRPETLVRKAISVLERRKGVYKPLEFTQKDHMILTKDIHLHRVYFVTHVIIIGTAYGTSPMSGAFSPELRSKLFELLVGWFRQIRSFKKIEPNLEPFYEICQCLLYLCRDDRNNILPPEMADIFYELLVPDASFLSTDSRENNDFVQRYHSRILVVSFLLEYDKYRRTRG
jgi:hypothetical protein